MLLLPGTLTLRESRDTLRLLSQALHHAERPERALAEAARIVKPGGRVLVLDLREHDEAWVRGTLGDRWLGFSTSALQALLTGAGLQDVTIGIGARRAGDPFGVVVARATRPVTVKDVKPVKDAKSVKGVKMHARRRSRTHARPRPERHAGRATSNRVAR